MCYIRALIGCIVTLWELFVDAVNTQKRRTIKNYFKKIINEERGRKFEPMIDYKYPTIASGATPIGSVGRAPDDVFS
jgi:hypothetical protein